MALLCGAAGAVRRRGGARTCNGAQNAMHTRCMGAVCAHALEASQVAAPGVQPLQCACGVGAVRAFLAPAGLADLGFLEMALFGFAMVCESKGDDLEGAKRLIFL